MRILIAEDERDMNRLIAKTLEKEGYGVDACFDGEAAVDYLDAAQYDAAILDVNMPKLDGFQVLKRIRDRGNDLPVLFLTARDSISDRVNGREVGRANYRESPFVWAAVLPPLRFMPRRRSGHRTSLLKIGDLQIDTGSHTVSRGGRPIELSAREYAILEYMALNKGNVLSREQIETHVWNFDYSGGSNVVDVYISYLRKKIDGGETVKLIRTVWGAGWMLKEDS